MCIRDRVGVDVPAESRDLPLVVAVDRTAGACDVGDHLGLALRRGVVHDLDVIGLDLRGHGSDKGLAAGCDIVSRDAYARLKLLSRWDKIDQLSDAEMCIRDSTDSMGGGTSGPK